LPNNDFGSDKFGLEGADFYMYLVYFIAFIYTIFCEQLEEADVTIQVLCICFLFFFGLLVFVFLIIFCVALYAFFLYNFFFKLYQFLSLFKYFFLI
jgi:hypothetical protein